MLSFIQNEMQSNAHKLIVSIHYFKCIKNLMFLVFHNVSLLGSLFFLSIYFLHLETHNQLLKKP